MSEGITAMSTPLIKQYREIKRECPESLLLFRVGDFYELFYGDAEVAARTFDLALINRRWKDRLSGKRSVPMAGFPHHQLERYLEKLIVAGFRAVVCDQVKHPANGVMRHQITRIVTRAGDSS